MKSEEPKVHTSNQNQPASNGTNLSTSMSYILQKVKRIREMLEIPFLTKQNPDDQLLFKELPHYYRLVILSKMSKHPFPC
jgi:hypothetical protein